MKSQETISLINYIVSKQTKNSNDILITFSEIIICISILLYIVKILYVLFLYYKGDKNDYR